MPASGKQGRSFIYGIGTIRSVVNLAQMDQNGSGKGEACRTVLYLFIDRKWIYDK